MAYLTEFQPNPSLVNYTNVLTPATNEVYVPETDAPDSLAFLMRNSVIVEYLLEPQADDKQTKKDEAAPIGVTSVRIY